VGEKVGKHPTDRGTLGAKRCLRTDGRGVPIGLAVDGAHRHDVKQTRETIERIAVARGEEAQARKPEAGCTARRWIVERTQSWMHRFRRVRIR
jgi:putative transposase